MSNSPADFADPEYNTERADLARTLADKAGRLTVNEGNAGQVREMLKMIAIAIAAEFGELLDEYELDEIDDAPECELQEMIDRIAARAADGADAIEGGVFAGIVLANYHPDFGSSAAGRDEGPA